MSTSTKTEVKRWGVSDIAVIALVFGLTNLFGYIAITYDWLGAGDKLALIGTYFTASALVFAFIIAYMQWLQHKTSSNILREVKLKIFEDVKGDFSQILDAAIELAAVCEHTSGARFSCGVQTHYLGALYRPTRKEKQHENFRDALVRLIKNGSKVTIHALPWFYPGHEIHICKPPPLIQVLKKIEKMGDSQFVPGLKQNFRDEIEFLKSIIDAQMECQIYKSTGTLNLHIHWEERAPINWVYFSRKGGVSRGMIFTSAGRDDDEDQIAGDLDSLVVGVTVTADSWSLITRIEGMFQARAMSLFKYAEPRLFRVALEKVVHKLIEPTEADFTEQNAEDLLGILAEALGTSELGSFTFRPEPTRLTPSISTEHTRYFYFWETDNAQCDIVILPSASGLYAYWKDSDRSEEESRFLRYDQLCRDLNKACSANVFLLSQGGQAGYGEWSPCAAKEETLAFLRWRKKKHSGANLPLFLFGICTGGLTAMHVFPSSEARGVAIWDLVPNPGFGSEHRQYVARKYEKTLAVSSDEDCFRNIDQSLKSGRACISFLKGKKETRKSFWVGGEDNARDPTMADSSQSTRMTRSWKKIVQVAKALGLEENEVYSAPSGTVGHVPGGPNEIEYKRFIASLKDWISDGS